jgi:hypothetical protein
MCGAVTLVGPTSYGGCPVGPASGGSHPVGPASGGTYPVGPASGGTYPVGPAGGWSERNLEKYAISRNDIEFSLAFR